ncbi:MAG: hypothetical protein RLZZ157_1633, partial [Pseudomonadota bacterium]
MHRRIDLQSAQVYAFFMTVTPRILLSVARPLNVVGGPCACRL